jgi:signal peptidase I
MTTQAHDPYRWRPRTRPVGPSRPTYRGELAKAVATLFCGACLALAGLMLLPGLIGYERYVITSGSMTGAYDRGSIVFDEVVPVADLRVGDVITYTPPPQSGPSGMITHRIYSIGTDSLGRPLFRTKGDANESPDPWTFTLDEPTQARVAFHVKHVGYLFAALAIRPVRLLVIGLPALLLAFGILAVLRREAHAEARA